MERFDVIIIGAGAAGLLAGWELVRTGRSVLILEARDRTGGRIHTLADPDFDILVEAGAEFVHGNLELTLDLLKKAGAACRNTEGSVWHSFQGELEQQGDFIEDFDELMKKLNALEHDTSVQSFIDEHLQEPDLEEMRLTLKNYVEGYYAGEATRVSIFALREELSNSSDGQSRPVDGYGLLIDFISAQFLSSGGVLKLSHAVTSVQWQHRHVQLRTEEGEYQSKLLLVTVPIGVWQQRKIAYSPSLDRKEELAGLLGYGPVIKTVLQFETAFWKDKTHTQGKDLSHLSFVFSDALVPTWWTQYPADSGTITGWSAGPHAADLKGKSEEQIVDAALESLSRIFSIDLAQIRHWLGASYVFDWTNDPFSLGGYSYEVVQGADYMREMKEPVAGTIFLAGEGLHHGPEIGTVEGALQSGRNVAYEMVAALDTPPL
jgi:monoamine oxidase